MGGFLSKLPQNQQLAQNQQLGQNCQSVLLTDLPDPILEDIFALLGFDDVLAVRLVCRQLEATLPLEVWVRTLECSKNIDSGSRVLDYSICTKQELLLRYRNIKYPHYIPFTNQSIQSVWREDRRYFRLAPYQIDSDERMTDSYMAYYKKNRSVGTNKKYSSLNTEVPCVRLWGFEFWSFKCPISFLQAGYYSVSFQFRRNNPDEENPINCSCDLLCHKMYKDSEKILERLGRIETDYWRIMPLFKWCWTPKVYFCVDDACEASILFIGLDNAIPQSKTGLDFGYIRILHETREI